MKNSIKIFIMLWTIFIATPLSVIYGYKLLHLVHATTTIWVLFWICQLSSFVYGSILQFLSEEKQ